MNQNGRASANALMLRSPAAATAKRGPLTELEKAREEANRARADGAAAQERAEQAKARMLKSTRDAKVRLRVTAVIMMTAALLRLAWEANSQPSAPVAKVILPIGQSSVAGEKTVAANSQPTQAEVALDRLRDAFHSFPDEDQPAVVSEVNTHYAGTELTCPLAWSSKGIPALSVKDNGEAVPLMAGALNQCAAGVEKLRQERDAAATLRSNRENSGRD